MANSPLQGLADDATLACSTGKFPPIRHVNCDADAADGQADEAKTEHARCPHGVTDHPEEAVAYLLTQPESPNGSGTTVVNSTRGTI